MPFTKGHKLATGRPLGSHNKHTTKYKDAIFWVYKRLGGKHALFEELKINIELRTEFWKQVVARGLKDDVTALELVGDGVQVRLIRFSDEETARNLLPSGTSVGDVVEHE